jgi:hypothetical protein
MNLNDIFNKPLEGNDLISLNNKFFPCFINSFIKLENYQKTNVTDEQKEINKAKFITKKRGRINKNSDYKNHIKRRIHNKYCNDNVRRKTKTLYHKYIIQLLNDLIKKKYENIRMKFVKMDIRITKDISIEYNRYLLEKKIKDIIINVSKKYQNKDNNIKCIRLMELQKDNEEILNILNMTYKDLFINYYLKSTKNNTKDNSYEAHKEKILSLYGKEYLDIYIKNTENFIEFFMNGKNRKSRKIYEIEEINIPSESTSAESQTNEVINKDNKNINKKMISVSTQTDIYDINAKLISFS